MSKNDLTSIAATDKNWAKVRAQAALLLIEKYQKGDFDLGKFRENMLNLVSGPGQELLDNDADDSELKTWLSASIETAARTGGQ